MAKIFSIVMGMGVMLLMLACAPQATPAATPASRAPQVATPVPMVVTPIIAEDAAWAKVVEAAKKEGKLTNYSYNFTGDVGIAMSRAFKERFGIQLDIVTGRGAEFIERLKTEKRMGGLVADLADGNHSSANIMKGEGLTVGIAGELPALRDKDTWVADIFGIDPQDKHIIAFTFGTYNPFVNTNLVKPGEEPKAWKDLLDPKWKGKMLAINPTISAGLLNNFVPLMREKVIDVDFIKALYKQDLRFSNAYPDEAGILGRGERSLTASATSTGYSKFINEGAPIRAVDLSDGTVLTATVVAAFNGAPHPNAAKVFINWFLSPEGQIVYSKAASAPSARKDVPSSLPKAAQITTKRPIVTTTEDSEESGRLFRQQWLNKLWGR